MWLRLRNTARRGRASVPARWRRIRAWRLVRAAPRLATCVMTLFPASLLLLAADLAGLAGLAADVLARVADALALVRLGLARGADLGGDLADELLVDADDGEPRRVLDLEADPGRRVDLDRVAVAQVELELLAVERGTVADAGDLEALAVAVGHPDDHVVHERPGEAVELLVVLLLGGPGDDDGAVLLADRDVRMERAAEGPLGALHRHGPPVDRHVDTRRDGDGKASDTRHVDRPTRRTRGLRRPAAPGAPAGRS